MSRLNFKIIWSLMLIAASIAFAPGRTADTSGQDPQVERVMRPGRTIKIPEDGSGVEEPFVPPPGTTTTRNLALGKPARQSSLSAWSTGRDDAEGGNDGKKSGEPRFGFHTDAETNPWWQVDLEGNYQLGDILIFNRRDKPEVARTIQVFISKDAVNWQRIYAHEGSVWGRDGQPLTYPPGGAMARYVRVQLNDRAPLHLEEIEVYELMTLFSGGGGRPTQPQPPIVTPPIVTPPIVTPPIVTPPIVTPPVGPPRPNARINAVTHNVRRPLRTGDTIEITLRGTPGLQATFDLPPLVKGAQLVEFDAGEYIGTYKVKPGDQIRNARVTAYLRGRDGDEDFLQAREPISIELVPSIEQPPIVQPPITPPTTGEIGHYYLNRIEVTRVYPRSWIDPLAFGAHEAGKKTYPGSQRNFPLGWDFRWPESKVNINRSMSTVTLTQVPATVEPAKMAALAATMEGDWNTTGYGDARSFTLILDGAAGKGEWTKAMNIPNATVQGWIKTTKTSTVPQAVNGEVVLPITAIIRFGWDHIGQMDISLIYGKSPAGGGSGATYQPPPVTGKTGRYRLSHIEVIRTSPQSFLAPLIEAGKKTYPREQRTFPLGWDFRWPESKVNVNRSMSTVTLTQVPNTLEPGRNVTFSANMRGEWNTTGYGIERRYRIRLDGAAGEKEWSKVLDVPVGMHESQLETSRTAPVPRPVNNQIIVPIKAIIRFGEDHAADMDIRLVYKPEGGG